MYFFLKTGKRYRPNSFCIVIYVKFVLGWTFFRTRSCPMTSSPYPVHADSKIFKIEKTSHVTHHSTPKTLKSSFPALLVSIRSVVRAIFMVFKKNCNREYTWEQTWEFDYVIMTSSDMSGSWKNLNAIQICWILHWKTN